ncbi:hypothetical protein J6Q66_05830 [bacterium]|nr:hypothetical protein [bacterium]
MNVDENLKKLVCSNCGSDEIQLVFGQTEHNDAYLAITGTQLVNPVQCKCNKCGYTWTPIFKTDEEDVEKERKHKALFLMFILGGFTVLFLFAALLFGLLFL